MNFFVIGMMIMQAASFSLGDELGFAESLGNLEGGRRRAISYRNGPPEIVGALPAAEQAPAYSAEKRIISRAAVQMPFTTQQQQQLQEALQQQISMTRVQTNPAALMTEARPLPMGVPAFRPIPKPLMPPTAQRRNNIAVDMPAARVSVNNKLIDGYSKPIVSNRTFHVTNPTVTISEPVAVPVFQAMPASVGSLTKGVAVAESRIANKSPNYLQFEEPKFDLQDVTLEELAQAANVSLDTIKHAIYVREQQMKAEQRAKLAAKLREEFIRTSTTTTSTTTTTTTPKSMPSVYQNEEQVEQNVALDNKISKVMNAPKEYYPVGYDKNFDDNFKSKVDLPPTSFACAKQKHFPGLYADTDLGCMVFHVCALTDDGLVRKSFLCPESTLFDQTILKCNWWFYVDCNASKSVYDSNIPISKSYQLMKSLTYFSKLNNNNKATNEDNSRGSGLDLKSLKDTMESSGRQLQNESSNELEPANEKTSDNET